MQPWAKLAEDKALAENAVLRREAAALREQLAKERQRETRREEARRPCCGRDGTGAARPGSPGGRQCAGRRDQLNVPYINRSQKENYGKDRNLSPGGQ